MCRRRLGLPSFNARFDEIFDRGIDPDVDDPTQCHAHPEVPDAWPSLDAAFLASAMRWLMLILLLGCAIWLINGALRRSGWLSSSGRTSGERSQH